MKEEKDSKGKITFIGLKNNATYTLIIEEDTAEEDKRTNKGVRFTA